MKKLLKSRTYSIKKHQGDFLAEITLNKRLILLTIIFIIGMLIGSGVVKANSDTLTMKLLSLFNSYTELKRQQSMVVNFCNSFINAFLYLLIVYCAGLCAVGTPIIYFVPLVRGMGFGIISGYLYREYMLSGVGYNLLMIFPGAIFYCIALSLACNESALMSKEILLMVLNKKCESDGSYRMYCVRFLIFCILTAFGAFAETLFFSLFSGYFNDM